MTWVPHTHYYLICFYETTLRTPPRHPYLHTSCPSWWMQALTNALSAARDHLASGLVLQVLLPVFWSCPRSGVRKSLLDCGAACLGGGPPEVACFAAAALLQGTQVPVCYSHACSTSKQHKAGEKTLNTTLSCRWCSSSYKLSGAGP